MAETRKVTVFYSWQSDSPKKTNLSAIRGALKIAAEKIAKNHPDLNIVPDEATRGTSGSPNIALKIQEKIEAADVFLADITTITPTGAKRPCPNPNVSYELGYAVGQLGWDRVILLFNESLGDFPKDLPFDIIQQRASPYKLAEADPNSARKPLGDFLATAILAVIEMNPKRPAELRGLTPEKFKHNHDVTNMEWLMSNIHLPTLDTHINELPHSITDRALWFWEVFKGVVANSLFNVYDPVLKSAVDKLFFAWQTALAHDEQYHNTWGGRVHVFTNPMDLPLPPKRQKIWDEIDKARFEMRKALDQILDRLRESYVEIDIHKTNEKAWKAHVDMEEEVKRGLSDEPVKKPSKQKKKAASRPRKKRG
jgi:hypothetical protein